MSVSKRHVVTAAVLVIVVAVVGVWVVHLLGRVDDPADARCPAPRTTFGDERDLGNHHEIDVQFRCEGVRLSGTVYLPPEGDRHPGVVWVHGAGEAGRLGFGGDLVPGLVRAGVVVLSYDKRGVAESGGACCPGDTGHFNLLTADAVGAVAALRKVPVVEGEYVGLVGASQAGWIAPRAANQSRAAFVALASSPTISERTSNLYERLAAGEDGDLSRKEISRRLRDEGAHGYDPRQDLSAMKVPGLWEFGTADEHTPVPESVAVLARLKARGHDVTVVTFPGAGHGLLDVPPSDPDAVPTMIRWITDHTG